MVEVEVILLLQLLKELKGRRRITWFFNLLGVAVLRTYSTVSPSSIKAIGNVVVAVQAWRKWRDSVFRNHTLFRGIVDG